MTRARMRPWSACLLAAALGLLPAALWMKAQSSRDAYRNAYRAWRETSAGLELDAGSAGETVAAGTAKAVQMASAYVAAHSSALKELAAEQSQNLEWLRANAVQTPPDLASAPEETRFASRESNAVSASIRTFANDPDRSLQQLRQALQREQAALEALKTAIADRQQAESNAVKTVSPAEQARAKALEQYTFLAGAISQAVDLMNQETPAWAAYYPKLADAARNPGAPPPVSVRSVNPVTVAANLPAAGDPSATAARAPITPLPLSRYTGVWNFQAGSKFFGSEPQFVDVSVHEENGYATGTFYARFKLPAGSTGDPVLRFQFSGDFKPTRMQTFSLQTSDGVAGSVQLIPGNAFNELEVNFSTEAKAGKIHQGDFVLVKQ